MYLTPTSSTAVNVLPPAGESNRRTTPTTDSAQEALTGLIRGAEEAAVNSAALEKLARVILHTEPAHTRALVAELLRHTVREAPSTTTTAPGMAPVQDPDAGSTSVNAVGPNASSDTEIAHIHELWKKHVSWHADANTKGTDLTPALPQSLAEFAAAYLREHPTEDARAFFLPFHQLAQRDIEIPDDISLAFSRGILPFETFRGLVALYVSQLRVREPEHCHFDFVANSWTDATYWRHSLAAMCSPITMSLLDGGAIKPETLLDWIGMTARVQNVAPGYAPQADASHAPSEYSHPVALLLADWSIANFYDQPVRNAALLRDPEKLRALADNLVPFKHIEYFLSVADSVDARALENEMDRVAAEYARSDTPNKTPQQRAFFYTHQFRTNMSAEQTRRLDESRRNLVVTPEQLYARIILGDELGETAEQELRDMSDLRKQAAETRDRLRHLHRAMENLRADISAGTPHGRQCARFADAWQGAITVLDDLLQPTLETRLAQNTEEIAGSLRAMSADLAFQITDMEEHQGIPASMLLA